MTSIEHTNEHTLVCSLVCSSLIHMIKKHTRKVVKNGRDSYYINIPKELVRELKIRERQKLTLKKRGKGIMVEDWEK